MKAKKWLSVQTDLLLLQKEYSFCFCCLLIAHDFSRNDEYVAGKDTLKSCPIFVDGQLYLCTDTPNVGHVDKKVKIMATKKAKAKIESLRQEKSEINRKMQECQVAMTKMSEAKRKMSEAMREMSEAMKQMKSRKREINEEIKKRSNRPIVWDDNTPLIELVIPCKMARFKKMLVGWQKYSRGEINPEKTLYFDFDLVNSKMIISDLKSAMINNDHLFNVSDRQLIIYMSKHSNLGGFDKIKKTIQRLE